MLFFTMHRVVLWHECVKLCRAVLRCVMPCCTMLCFAMPCQAMLCHAMLCHATLCYAMLCYAMLCYAMLCYAMPCIITFCMMVTQSTPAHVVAPLSHAGDLARVPTSTLVAAMLFIHSCCSENTCRMQSLCTHPGHFSCMTK